MSTHKVIVFGLVVMLLVGTVGITVGGLLEEVRANELMGGVIEIRTWEDLHDMRDDLAGSYRLMNDLGPEDVGYDEYASDQADRGAGWLPVGDGDNRFTGRFDGQNHTLTGFYIYRPSTNHIGLFGYIDGGEVRNIGMVDASVSGDERVGGLVGWNRGMVSNSYATGDVSRTGWWVGGLVGENGWSGTVENSYATGTVSGSDWGIGGLVGWNRGMVSNSYATGDVSG